MTKPIVWTIAGSDSGGGAGIQADLHTFQAFDVHGCSVITALTAQNSKCVTHIEYTSPKMLAEQINVLAVDLPPVAIKIGMLGSLDTLQTLAPLLKNFSVPIVYDPVLITSTGDALYRENIRQYLLQHFLPLTTLLTPNLFEAEWLLERKITTNAAMEQAAHDLLKWGPKAVLLKGGHALEFLTENIIAEKQTTYSQDYWTNGQRAFWLSSPRLDTTHQHGSGCTLSSAIAANLAQGHSIDNALVIAKMYVNQGLQLAEQVGAGAGPIAHRAWLHCHRTHHLLPWITHTPHAEPVAFPACETPLGFYPIVDSSAWVERLLKLGVCTIQLRIKINEKMTQAKLAVEIEKSIHLARQYNARLFINDHWQLALAYGAYGVHLGQTDLAAADFAALRHAGLRLGISTATYSDLARAHTLRPSYIGVGPIYPTTSKITASPPLGLATLQHYCRLLHYPLVAIGGITLKSLPAIQAMGVNGVAVISAILKADDPEQETQRWLEHFKN